MIMIIIISSNDQSIYRQKMMIMYPPIDKSTSFHLFHKLLHMLQKSHEIGFGLLIPAFKAQLQHHSQIRTDCHLQQSLVPLHQDHRRKQLVVLFAAWDSKLAEGDLLC